MELMSKASVQYVVAAACPWMGAWLCLMMQPSHLPIDLNMLLEVKARAKVNVEGHTMFVCSARNYLYGNHVRNLYYFIVKCNFINLI